MSRWCSNSGADVFFEPAGPLVPNGPDGLRRAFCPVGRVRTLSLLTATCNRVPHRVEFRSII